MDFETSSDPGEKTHLGARRFPVLNTAAITAGLDLTLMIGLAIFLTLLPFHLVIKKSLPGPVGDYWKEMLLGVLALVWGLRVSLEAAQAGGKRQGIRVALAHVRDALLGESALHPAVLAYLGLLLLRFVLDRPRWSTAWGLYASLMYLPVFWLVSNVLRRYPNRLPWLMALLTGVGALVAVGGLAEFVLDRPLWPSDELLQRYGSYDAFIYGTHLRRVYFTFDSPTTLANTLAVLLPLALALARLARNKWVRLAVGVAAALMAACIVVAFSRGIWVALVISLLAMGVLSLRMQRNRQLLTAAAALALVGATVGATWGLVAWLRPGQTAPAYQGVVELPPQAYWAAPATAISRDLLRTPADYGQAVTQTWTLYDPIAGQDDTRTVLYEHPPQSGKVELIYRLTIPQASALRFAVALSPQVWSPEKGDGASFQLYVANPDHSQSDQFIFIRYINPKHNPSDRRWRNFLVDLSPWAGQTVNLSVITEGGPAGDWSFDWAGWADLQVVSMPADYFATAQAENAVLRYTGSILDWVRDETNRDRLAAWRLGMEAWRAAPLWGQGLGSTGLAALRTDPQHAFVTESQVLKVVVELGLPGLLVWAYLWFQIARTGYCTYRTYSGPARQALLLGLLTSLLLVFIEGWVYQNLEVKQVNAYFWTVLGCLAWVESTADKHR